MNALTNQVVNSLLRTVGFHKVSESANRWKVPTRLACVPTGAVPLQCMRRSYYRHLPYKRGLTALLHQEQLRHRVVIHGKVRGEGGGTFSSSGTNPELKLLQDLYRCMYALISSECNKLFTL